MKATSSLRFLVLLLAVFGSRAPAQTNNPLPTSRLVNLSVRTNAGIGADTLIVGFNLAGTGSRPLLIRGIGPGLAPFGVAGVLADPTIRLDASGGALIAQNDNWGTEGTAIASTAVSVGAFALPAGSRDAAVLQTLSAGSYTAQVGGGTGTALVEVYDAGTGATMRLANVSARTRSGSGGDIIIAGFVIAGTGEKRLVVRGIGPGLGQFGVTGLLADPRLEIFSGTTKINENDNWNSSDAATFLSIGAFPLLLASRDAALVVILQPGSYTAQVSGVNNSAGVALVEIYEAPGSLPPVQTSEVEIFGAGSTPFLLFRIAPTTGTASPIAATGNFPGLKFRRNGVLYGASSTLRIVSPADGSSVLVGNLPELIVSIAFSPDDVLHGLSNDGRTLYRIDPATGRTLGSVALTGTTHANGSPFEAEINGIDFGPDGTLYGIGFSLYTINVNTGVATKVTTAGRQVSGDLFSDLDMGPDGRLRATTSGTTGVGSNLYEVDLTSGIGQRIGAMGAAIGSLASRRAVAVTSIGTPRVTNLPMSGGNAGTGAAAEFLKRGGADSALREAETDVVRSDQLRAVRRERAAQALRAAQAEELK